MGSLEVKEKYKITVIAILLVTLVIVTYYFHAVLGTGTVFTHFFYIPIILAAFWWKRKGIFVAILSAILLIISRHFLRDIVTTANDYFRATMFMVISFVVAILSERIEQAQRSLQKSEERLSSFMNSATDGFFLLDSELNYIETNKVGLDIFPPGTEKKDIIGKSVREIMPDIREAGLYNKYMDILRTGKPLFIDVIIPHLKYGDMHIALKAFRVGNNLGIITTDITERKRTQERIEHLNRVLRTIRNINQIIIRENDRDKMIKITCDILIENRSYYNAWIALFDESRGVVSYAEAGLGKDFSSMIELLESGELTDCFKRALEGPGVISVEDPVSECIKCPLSKKYAVRSGMTVRLEHGGTIYGILCISISKDLISDEEERALLEEIAGDIAFALHDLELEKERKQTEDELLKSEKNFRTLVENSLTGISIIQDGQVIYTNPEQERLGFLPILLNSEDFSQIHPEDIEKVKSFHQSLSQGVVHPRSIDFRFYPPDKKGSGTDMQWIQYKANLIEYQGKEAILVNIIDITKSKELEYLLRIQDKMSSLGHVAAGIAHEIRNPLAGINIYLNKLEKIYDKGENLEKIAEILPQISLASSKIESVIKRVMDFSKPSQTKLVLADVNKSIEDAINLCSVSLRKSGIKIEKALSHDLPKCYADLQMIAQVVLNLINNAADAMKDFDGIKKIKVTSSAEGNRIFLRVSDSGPGVPLNLREDIFDPFFTTKDGGTGIGLSICHRIITDHGGTLDVFESEWGGAEFVIEIPSERSIDHT